MIRLSIIVPFFNVEEYIEQCIRSLYAQDIPLDDYEVICVDDCSPDGSRAIVEHLQGEFSNLQLIIHNQEKKVGGARNTGLRYAKGQYIWFVDSDDYIVPNCLGLLLNEAEKYDLDLLQFDFNRLIGNELIPFPVSYEDNIIYTGTEFIVDQSHVSWNLRISVAWGKLQKRVFLLDNKLLFTENVMFEDTDLSLFECTLAKRVKHINMAPYCYRKNMEGFSNIHTVQSMMFAILQQNRCLRAYYSTSIKEFKELIDRYIRSQLIRYRMDIKKFKMTERIQYSKIMSSQSITGLRRFCNWRTWLAIKFGITCFVKEK